MGGLVGDGVGGRVGGLVGEVVGGRVGRGTLGALVGESVGGAVGLDSFLQIICVLVASPHPDVIVL